jgi:chromosome segregation ATPase
VNRSRYLFNRFLLSLGIAPSEKTKMAAAFEAHLLQDSEITVGNLVWRDVEHIEDLSNEYWALRKLSKKHRELSEKIDNLSEDWEKAQQNRFGALETIQEHTSDKANKRDEYTRQLERLTRERDNISGEITNIQRRIKGFETKMEVLTEESSETSEMELDKTREQLGQYEKRLSKLESRMTAVQKEISQLRDNTNRLSDEITTEEGETRQDADHHFNQLGSINKNLTTLRSEAGTLESEALGYYTQIGRYLIENSDDPEVKRCTKKYRALFNLIKLMRKSYFRNQKLQV